MEAILRVVEHFCSLQEADIFVVLKQSLCWCGSYFTGILCIVMYGKNRDCVCLVVPSYAETGRLAKGR